MATGSLVEMHSYSSRSSELDQVYGIAVRCRSPAHREAADEVASLALPLGRVAILNGFVTLDGLDRTPHLARISVR